MKDSSRAEGYNTCSDIFIIIIIVLVIFIFIVVVVIIVTFIMLVVAVVLINRSSQCFFPSKQRNST